MSQLTQSDCDNDRAVSDDRQTFPGSPAGGRDVPGIRWTNVATTFIPVIQPPPTVCV